MRTRNYISSIAAAIAFVAVPPAPAALSFAATATQAPDRQRLIEAGLKFAARPDAIQQMELAKQRFDDAQVEIDTEFAKTFVATLKGAADFGSFMADVRDLKKLPNATPEYQKLYDVLRPLKRYMPKLTEGQQKTFGHLSKAYDLIDSLNQDIEDHPNGSFIALSSHTREQMYKFGLEWVTDSDILNDFVKGPGSKKFRLAAGAASFGAADIAAGLGALAGNNWDIRNADAMTDLLDGINKTAWGVFGLVLSRGNKDVADAFATAGGGVAWAAREVTLPGMIAWQIHADGFDKPSSRSMRRFNGPASQRDCKRNPSRRF